MQMASGKMETTSVGTPLWVSQRKRSVAGSDNNDSYGGGKMKFYPIHSLQWSNLIGINCLGGRTL